MSLRRLIAALVCGLGLLALALHDPYSRLELDPAAPQTERLDHPFMATILRLEADGSLEGKGEVTIRALGGREKAETFPVGPGPVTLRAEYYTDGDSDCEVSYRPLGAKGGQLALRYAWDGY